MIRRPKFKSLAKLFDSELIAESDAINHAMDALVGEWRGNRYVFLPVAPGVDAAWKTLHAVSYVYNDEMQRRGWTWDDIAARCYAAQA